MSILDNIFKVSKSSNIDNIKNNVKTENKLYIFKESNNLGRIFFDYDNDTRIEIGPNENVYYCDLELVNDSVVISSNDLKLINTESYGIVLLENVMTNSFIITKNNLLYNIRLVDRLNNEIHIRKIYSQKNLMWNDYYE